MTIRASAPIGSPCWADPWMSDIEGSRKFYSELFGWRPRNPARTSVNTPCSPATAFPPPVGWVTWKTCRPTTRGRTTWPPTTLSRLLRRPRPVELSRLLPPCRLRTSAFRRRSSTHGAHHGIWQPGTFPGFTVLNEHGAPSRFELHTRPRGRCCLLSHRLPLLGHEDCGRQRPVLLHDYAGS